MERASIDLPTEDLAWAQTRVEAGEAASVEDYFHDLAAQDRAARIKTLNALLEEGLNSGVDPRSIDQIFADLRAKHHLAN